MPTRIILAGVTMTRITNGTPRAGGSSIIPNGFENITRSGSRMVIGALIIIGMIAIGGKHMIHDGLMNIIPIGSSV